jgi:hypothetical protein
MLTFSYIIKTDSFPGKSHFKQRESKNEGRCRKENFRLFLRFTSSNLFSFSKF